MPDTFLPKEIAHVSKVLGKQREALVLRYVFVDIAVLVHAIDLPVRIQGVEHQTGMAPAAERSIHEYAALLATDAESFKARRCEDWDVVCSGVHESILVGGFDVFADLFGERTEVKIFHVVQHIAVVTVFAPHLDFFTQAGYDDLIVIWQFNPGMLE